jgi:hypothetical protein
MSHIPSLEPRTPQPRPNPGLIGVFEVIMALGVIRFVIRALDMFGEGEAALDIYRLLPNSIQFLGNPVFSSLAIVAGFAGLGWQAARQAKSPTYIPKRQLVDPFTKLPISSKPRIWPKVKRPVWVCIIAVVVAIPIWASYKTPLRLLILGEPQLGATIKYPIPPVLDYAPQPPKNHDKVPAVAPRPSPEVLADNKSTPGITTPIQAIPSQPPPALAPQRHPAQPIPDSQAECPKGAGTLTGEWSMNVEMNGLGGGYGLNYTFDQTVVRSLFPLLQKMINPQTKKLSSAQLIEAITLSEEVDTHLPSPTSIRVNQQLLSPEQTLYSIKRSFLSNSDYLQLTYSTRLPSGQDLGNAEGEVPIKSLSATGQRTISEFDQLVKAWGDASCKDAMNRLTKPQ